MNKIVTATTFLILSFISSGAADKVACTNVRGKLQDLTEAVDALCDGGAVPPSPIRQTWTSVPITSIGSTNLRNPSTLSFVIPDIIPSKAKNVLIYASVYTGHANTIAQNIKIFTQDGSSKHYEKYLYIYSYPQNAINTNSENMWFPMPANRRIFMTVTSDAGTNCGASLHAIGYN